jgi:hypothetical protein
MSVKTRQRRYNAIIDEEKIKRQLQHITYKDVMYVKAGNLKFGVKMTENSGSLIVKFASKKKIKGEKLKVFWNTDQHIEFEGIINSSEKTSTGLFEYTIKIFRILLPEKGRQDIRYKTDDRHYRLGKIIYSTVVERPTSIVNTDEFKNYILEIRKRLDNFAFIAVYPFNSTNAPTEVFFSKFSESIVFIRDLSSYNMFIKKNEKFFSQYPKLEIKLKNRLRTLYIKYKSLLVRPVDYLPMAGRQFPIAYVAAASIEDEIQNDEILAIDEASLDLYNDLTSAFYKELNISGRIVNVSVSGARLYIDEVEYFDTFNSISTFSFTLRILGVADISVTGNITYIQKVKSGFYLGIKFVRSAFGSRFNKFLHDTIMSHNLPID